MISPVLVAYGLPVNHPANLASMVGPAAFHFPEKEGHHTVTRISRLYLDIPRPDNEGKITKQLDVILPAGVFENYETVEGKTKMLLNFTGFRHSSPSTYEKAQYCAYQVGWGDYELEVAICLTAFLNHAEAEVHLVPSIVAVKQIRLARGGYLNPSFGVGLAIAELIRSKAELVAYDLELSQRQIDAP